MNDINLLSDYVVENKRRFLKKLFTASAVTVFFIIFFLLMYIPYFNLKAVLLEERKLKTEYDLGKNKGNSEVLETYQNSFKYLKENIVKISPKIERVNKSALKDIKLNSICCKNKNIIILGESSNYSAIGEYISSLEKMYTNSSVTPLWIEKGEYNLFTFSISLDFLE